MLQIAYAIQSLMYLKISMVFHNGSNYDYHCIIKELAEELEKTLTCLGKHTEKYITFTVPIEAMRIDEKENKSQRPYVKYYNY